MPKYGSVRFSAELWTKLRVKFKQLSEPIQVRLSVLNRSERSEQWVLPESSAVESVQLAFWTELRTVDMWTCANGGMMLTI